MPAGTPYDYRGDGEDYAYNGDDDLALPPSSSEESGAEGPPEAPFNEDSGADGPSEGPSASHDWAPPPSHPNVHPSAPSVVFNVMDYGAVPNRKKDNTKAFSIAWGEACAKKGKEATLFVPNLSFYLGPMKFEGPCYQNESPKVEIQGTLVAPANLGAFPDKHWISFRNLNGIEVTGGGASTFGILDGQGHKAWQKRKHHKLTEYRVFFPTLNLTNSCILSLITLLNSKGYHMSFTGSKNIRVHDINITAPWNSPNTDGIHTGTTDNINITNSVIGVGDDCVSIGPGTTNVHIHKVSCGPGHGISIGSLGKYKDEDDVGEVHVRNCTISDTTNGVRIKTWPDSEPSKAYNISFVDVVVRNVTNPIIIDQEYCPSDGCKFSKPSRVQISNVTFLNITGTTSPKPHPAVSIICSRGAPCQDVKLIQVNLTQVILDGDQRPAINETGLLKVNDFVKDLEVINSPLLIVNDE
uniref:Polygalacturonase n=1 Tax=Kalanchoe fedtschenkoi TaxID=63787 RepID=A0A7N0UFN2_KALFE